MEVSVLLLLLIFLVALLYSSVGHGGASGYLALMALYGFGALYMKVTAMALNVFVAGISFIFFYRSGFFRWKLFFPFAISSVPAAFLGAQVVLDDTTYKKIVGVLLLFPIARILGLFGEAKLQQRPVTITAGLIIGAAIGLISGMIGIGGGIILSPIMILCGWGTMKESAAVAALFIVVNSIAGIFGTQGIDLLFQSNMAVVIAVALFGGMIGSYLGSNKATEKVLRPTLALVLFIAGIKLVLV